MVLLLCQYMYLCFLPSSLVRLKVESPAKAACETHYVCLACRSSESGTGERVEEKNELERMAGANQLQAVCQQYLQVLFFNLC